MPPPDNPAVARAVLNVQRDTRSFANVFHVMRQDEAVLTLGDLLDIANAIEAWWTTNYRTSVVNLVSSVSAVVTKLDPDDPLQHTQAFTFPGTVGSPEVEPANVTAVLSWRTGLAGRKHRGRTYHVGVDGDQLNTTDTIQGGYMAQLLAVATAFLVQLGVESMKAVVFHRSDNTKTDITSAVVDQLVDSMRTRLAGRGT